MKFRSICYPSAASRDGRGPLGDYRRNPSPHEAHAGELRFLPLDLAARLHNARASRRLLLAELPGELETIRAALDGARTDARSFR